MLKPENFGEKVMRVSHTLSDLTGWEEVWDEGVYKCVSVFVCVCELVFIILVH